MWRINYIFPNICRKWQGRRCVGRDCVHNVFNINNIVCIRFTTDQCLIVINVPLKVSSFNPLFILIFIDKIFIDQIFTVNGSSLINIVVIIIVIIIVNGNSLINIVVVIIIVVIIITIGMNILSSTCVEYLYWASRTVTCKLVVVCWISSIRTSAHGSNCMYNSMLVTSGILSNFSNMIFTCLSVSIAIYL